MAVIHGESCFEKNAFEVTENPHLPTKTRLPVKEYLGKYLRYRKKNYFLLKLFLQPILFHGKLNFDNLTYFKLYGKLNSKPKKYKIVAILGTPKKEPWILFNVQFVYCDGFNCYLCLPFLVLKHFLQNIFHNIK